MDTINPIVGNLVKALVYTENGGHPSVGGEKAGGSGEMKSLWQYMPDTWKVYSRQVTGKDDIPLTPENEAAVTYGKVNGWYNQLVKDGVPEDEIPLKIGSMWNAGEHRPDAYKQGVKGKNKSGIQYDTPAYAKKVASYFNQFKGGSGNTQIENKTPVSGGGNPGLIEKSTPPFTLKRKINPGIMKPQIKES